MSQRIDCLLYTSYVLGCGIEGQHFIKIMMIQLFLYHLLDVTEVYHHSVCIQPVSYTHLVGRAPVSKTGCREFEPLLPC